MANSALTKYQSQFWPLGNVLVAASGTPVRLTSLIDPTDQNDPNALTTATAAEYTIKCNQIVLQGYKQTSLGAAPMIPNVGNVYVLIRGKTATGAGNKNDSGVMIGVIPAGGSWSFSPSAMNLDPFSPYDLLIDADNSGDGVIGVLFIQ
jgi:hypothetical protein